MHKTTNRFWECLDKLPEFIQQLAQKNFGIKYRALAVRDGNDFIWVWIGTHDEYERIIK